MAEHGNLIWSLSMTFGEEPNTGTEVRIQGYDYAEMHNRASRLYTHMHTLGLPMRYFDMYLRYDNSVDPVKIYDIFCHWDIDREHEALFFEDPQVSWKALRRSR